MRRTLLLATLVLGAAAPAFAAPSNNIVIRWNDAMLDAVAKNPPSPTATCWRMYMTSASMYEAWAAYDEVAVGVVFGDALRRPASQRTLENKREAVSQAAYYALSRLYPNQEPDFRALLEELGYRVTKNRGLGNPSGLGHRAAEGVFLDRADDGSNAANGFVQMITERYPELYEPVNSADPTAPNAPGGASFDPNRWQPLRVPNGTLVDEHGIPIFDNDDPSTYVDQKFLTPHWGGVRPFAMLDGAQFRPVAPPQFGSQEPYTDALGVTTTSDEACHLQFDEVLTYSANLTDRHKIIAEFWADGPRTWTPPGHWNQIAYGISIRDGHTLDDDIKMFFALNGALLDASIACWECKRHYDLIRPVSALRHHHFDEMILAWAGPNMGTQEILGQNWQPYQAITFVTPAFAEYVSGHSTFSRSAREVLLLYSGTDAMYDGVTLLGDDYDLDGVEDYFGQHIALPGSMQFEDGPAETVTLRWETMLEASNEAGISRLYGGIHIQDGNLRGQEIGSQVGPLAYAKAQSYWTGAAAADKGLSGGLLAAGLDGGPGNGMRGVGLALASQNPSATGFRLRFTLPNAGPVQLDVYDPSGRRVRQIFSGTQTQGEHYAVWDGASDGGRRVASGLYFVRLRALGQEQVLKVATLQ